MKWLLLPFSLLFLGAVTLAGVPLSMRLKELSRIQEQVVFQSQSETVIRILAIAGSVSIACEGDPRSVCARPVNYSHLRTNFPIRLEACRSGEEFPGCDDRYLEVSFTTRDLLKAGLRI